MTDPRLVAQGIIKLVSETVADEELDHAWELVGIGYPLEAIFYALATARDHGGWVNEGIREIVYREIDWPADELEIINLVLRDTPLKAA